MPDLDFVFSPKSIAVVGVSSNPDARVNQNFLRPLLDFGYPGRIYAVNPHTTEVMGLKTYANVQDIPEPVDYVICALPAPLTPKLIQDCAAARAKVVTLFSAGFSETGEEEGIRLEGELLHIARHGGVRLIGPNCLGIHCPRAGVTLEPSIPRESGQTSFLSQSGGNARELIHSAAGRGIFFNKLVSYGNALDLNEADFLEYFTGDEGTRVIAAYIEGIKQPQRFLRALREACEAKPVIVLKGGKTEAGTGAVNCHTGALAGSTETWEALCRQVRAIEVHDTEEMTDTILAFSNLEPPRGRRVGIVGIGGGASVQAADDCESTRLVVPALPPALREELKRFNPPKGTGLRNPVDAAADVYWDPASFARTAEMIARWDGIDILLVMLSSTATLMRGVDTLRGQIGAVVEMGRSIDKPLAIILRTAGIARAESMAKETEGLCFEAGFPVYRSCSQAARAIDHLVSYHERRAGIESNPKY